VTDIKSEYSFRDAQYEGAVNDCRLYRAGYQAAVQAAEYELGSQGNSPTEEEIAHQHLAIAQFTGESVNPQAFLTDLWPHSMYGGRSATIGSVTSSPRRPDGRRTNGPKDDV